MVAQLARITNTPVDLRADICSCRFLVTLSTLRTFPTPLPDTARKSGRPPKCNWSVPERKVEYLLLGVMERLAGQGATLGISIAKNRF